jgi:hypothetical protein
MTVIPFPKRHGSTSTGRIRKRAGSASSLPRRASSKEKASRKAAGKPRFLQLETAVGPTLASLAARDGPPTASITESIVVSIPNEYSHRVNMSSVPVLGMEQPCELRNIHGMHSTRAVAARLKRTREALGIDAAELCRQTGIAPNAWSQFESGTRRITEAKADRLCEVYGLTLDWIYRERLTGLPGEFRDEIRKRA